MRLPMKSSASGAKQQTTVDTAARDEQITVYEDHYTVELKSGLSVNIDAE